MTEWINIKDRLPSINGRYLVVYHFFQYREVRVLSFAKNLHKVDEYDFPDKKRPGWYICDSEVGYVEMNGVTYWAELPEMPDEGE